MKSTHNFSNARFCIIATFLLLIVCIPLAAENVAEGNAENDVRYVPDSFEVREELIETWFTQDIALVLKQEPQIVQNRVGDHFLVRAEDRGEEVVIIVAPLVLQLVEIQNLDIIVDGIEIQTETTLHTEVVLTSEPSERWIETWPEDASGSWVLSRDAKTGESLRVRYYFMPDPEVYVQFTQGEGKCFCEFSVFGALVASRVPIPVPIAYFYTASLEDIQYLTRHTLPWNYANVYDLVYDENMQMVGVIRELIPDLRQADMLMSATGNLDFLKWIVDGLVKPLAGNNLLDEPLQQSTMGSKVSVTAINDTYKSFDYIRNLAAAAISVRTSIDYYYNTSGADVKTEPFSLYRDADGVLQRAEFAPNAGYSIDMLKPVLYVLAVTEPGRFFLGAVREILPPPISGGKIPEKHIYDRAVAFFPWFDSNGNFQIAIFEDGFELTYEQFTERYPDSFVHLVRIKASMDFYPDEPENIEESTDIGVNE